VSGLRLTGGVASDGGAITVDCLDGRIAAVMRGGAVAKAPAGTHVVDVSGHVLMSAMAEPHADLDGAIVASRLSFMASSASDIERNARRAFAAYAAKGCLAVRSHVVVANWIGLRSLEGVVHAAEAFAPFLDIQLVAHGAPPATGLNGAEERELLSGAIALGATHIGGSPYRAYDPREETATLLEIAGNAGVPVDFHTDETIDPAMVSVRDLAELVMATGFTSGVAASHCVSLGVIPPAMQAEVAGLLAASNVAVISLPQTNLYLQSREVGHAKPRGLTALDALYAAGVSVAAGGDNVQDPFNPMGRADPLETASLLVTAGHLDVAVAFDAVSASARRVMGVDAQGITEGAPADLVAVPGQTLRGAIAEGDPRRVVVRRGEVVDAATLAELTDGWKPTREVVGV
jgi:cytosine deaminase